MFGPQAVGRAVVHFVIVVEDRRGGRLQWWFRGGLFVGVGGGGRILLVFALQFWTQKILISGRFDVEIEGRYSRELEEHSSW